MTIDFQFEVSFYYSVASVSDFICFSMGAAINRHLLLLLGLVFILYVSEYFVFRMREVIPVFNSVNWVLLQVDGSSYWIWPRS